MGMVNLNCFLREPFGVHPLVRWGATDRGRWVRVERRGRKTVEFADAGHQAGWGGAKVGELCCRKLRLSEQAGAGSRKRAEKKFTLQALARIAKSLTCRVQTLVWDL